MKLFDFIKHFFICKCKTYNQNKGCVSNPHTYNMNKEEAIKDFMVDMVEKLKNLQLYEFFEFQFGNSRGAARCLSVEFNVCGEILRDIEVEIYADIGYKRKHKRKFWYFYTAKCPSELLSQIKTLDDNIKYEPRYGTAVYVVEEIIKIFLFIENTRNLKNWDYYLKNTNQKREV